MSDTTEKEFTPPEDDMLCINCMYGEWRHGKPGLACKNFDDGISKPNNQSLDRVRLREQLEEFALHLKPGTTKGNHRTAIFDTVELTKLVETLINSELQNLRQELVREIEGLKKEFDLSMLDVTGSEIDTHNEAIDKVLAIIKGDKDVQE